MISKTRFCLMIDLITSPGFNFWKQFPFNRYQDCLRSKIVFLLYLLMKKTQIYEDISALYADKLTLLSKIVNLFWGGDYRFRGGSIGGVTKAWHFLKRKSFSSFEKLKIIFTFSCQIHIMSKITHVIGIHFISWEPLVEDGSSNLWQLVWQTRLFAQVLNRTNKAVRIPRHVGITKMAEIAMHTPYHRPMGAWVRKIRKSIKIQLHGWTTLNRSKNIYARGLGWLEDTIYLKTRPPKLKNSNSSYMHPHLPNYVTFENSSSCSHCWVAVSLWLAAILEKWNKTNIYFRKIVLPGRAVIDRHWENVMCRTSLKPARIFSKCSDDRRRLSEWATYPSANPQPAQTWVNMAVDHSNRTYSTSTACKMWFQNIYALLMRSIWLRNPTLLIPNPNKFRQ